MADKKISELPLGVANANSVVPADNASSTVTEKIKLDDIVKLPHTHNKTDVGLGNVDNTSDANKPVSTSVQTALDLKAPIANPTFTGTVNGITKGMVGLGNVDNTSDANKPISGAVQTALDSKANLSHTHDDRYYTEGEVDTLLATKQASGNYATLVNDKVPTSQLPSYVDDVLESNNFASLPVSGETGKIYVTLDNNKTYRWSGSAYIEISASPGSTDSVPEGSINKYYTDARASAAAPVQSVSGRTGAITLTKSDVGLGNVDNTSDINKPVSTAAQTALDLKATKNNPQFTGMAFVKGDLTISPPCPSYPCPEGYDISVGGLSVTDGVDSKVRIAPNGNINAAGTLYCSSINPTNAADARTNLGLGNVDNTSDANKPVSTATQTALDGKASKFNPTGKTIYVDANTGTDTRTGLSQYDLNFPFATLASAISASAIGDTVYVRAGSYTISTQISLNNKGNLYFEQGANVTVASGVVAFSLTANQPKSIAGYCNFTCSGTGGVWTQSGGSATVQLVSIQCSSIVNLTGAGTVFAVATGVLGINIPTISAFASTVVSQTATSGNVFYEVLFTYCAKLLDMTQANSGAQFTCDCWTVMIYGAEGMSIVGGTTSLRIENFVLNPSVFNTAKLVVFKFANSDNTTNFHVLRGGKIWSSAQPCITFNATTATNKYVELFSGVVLISDTNAIVSANTRSITSFGAHISGLPDSNVTIVDLSGTPASHTHGNITNAGAIGSSANLPVITTTSGVLTTGSFGTTANSFCQGNDSRLSDARIPTAHTHDDRYYTESEVDTLLSGRIAVNSPILSLGTLSGSNAINFGSDQLLQTLTLNGSAVTFTKGTGWPTTNVMGDIILRITVTSATSITWTVVNDWFAQPPAGALSIGTHLFLLRAIGSSIIEGHYIGSKTNLDAGPAPTTTAAPTTTTAAPTTTTAAPTTTTAAPTTTTAAPAFNPMAVLLTSGSSYTVPSGATSMKAWAVGAGHGQDAGGLNAGSARGGSVAYKTWSVSGGQSVAYSINNTPQYQNGPPSYSATGSTADTTVTFNGQTIRGLFGNTGPVFSGNINDETSEGSGVTWLQFSGGDGLALGGGHQTNSPNSGYYYRGGAAGGNSPSPSCGAGGFRRNVLTDVSGLKAALTLAGAKVTDDCNNPQAFGNGGLDSKFNGVLSAGLGGGAINMQAGNGAVILYFT